MASPSFALAGSLPGMAAWDELNVVGAQALPLISYRVADGATERVPLLIGTASFTPELGYSLPPGSWGIQAPLDLAPDRRTRHRRLTPVLPLTITT